MLNQQNINDAQTYISGLMDDIKRTMFGIDDVIRLCIIALFIEKHVLLEGNPGLGKTSLVKAIAERLALKFGRIQFTPDLLPSDILITPRMNDATGQFDLADGPIFTSLLLADEINRATQKTQSALLEAMGERQVTVNGKTKSLVEDNTPFMVLATQNPVDHEGTYDLPEAQLDRFAFKILMPNPTQEALRNILNKTSGRLFGHDEADTPPQSSPTLSEEQKNQQESHQRRQTITRYRNYGRMIRAMQPSSSFQQHLENLFHASNKNFDVIRVRNLNEVKNLVEDLRYGLGPRALTDFMLGAKAWTLFFGHTDSIVGAEAFKHILHPVLSHRIKLKYSATLEINAYITALALACIPAGRDIAPQYEHRIRELLS